MKWMEQINEFGKSVTKYWMVVLLVLIVLMVWPSRPANANSTVTPTISVQQVDQLKEANRQLKRIADALEIIAGTGSRTWKAPAK